MNSRFSRIMFFFTLIMLLGSFQPANQSKYHVKTIVIDAGHGGKDPGCVSGSTYEKDIALAVALELGKMIKTNYPDIKVVYTRDNDSFVELYERAAIANRNKANLFISIHINTSKATTVTGTESWIMGLHKSEANLAIAMKENAVIQLEDNYKEKYEGFDPNSPEAYIIFTLYQNAFLEQSLSFATKIEEQFKTQTNRPSRGVKQAGFLVLWKTTMPAVLVEAGFLSNADEKKFLVSKDGQESTARGIFNAFKEFKSELETSGN